MMSRASLNAARKGSAYRFLLHLSVLPFRPEDNRSASEEAVWLAEDIRREEFFSETRRIQYGLDVGARM
jgi:hypothetical protein